MKQDSRIQIFNAEAAIEKYVFEIISMNTGIPFNFDKINNQSSTFSIVYFQNPVKFIGNSIYIYKSKRELGNRGDPDYLIDNNISSISIPIFYSKFRSLNNNVLFSFSNDIPAIWKGYDNKKRPYIVVNFDLIKNIGYHLTRYEEYDNGEADSYQRFLTSDNTLYHYKIHEYPVVDYLIELLLNVSSFFDRNKFVRKNIWPDGKKYAVCLTHDVDNIKMKTIPRFVNRTYQNLKSKNSLVDKFRRFKELRNIYSLKEDIFDNFDHWVDIESKYGFRSTSYFLSRTIFESLLSTDIRYRIGSKYLRGKIKELHAKGWEVGLHGYRNSKNKLRQEKKLLESVLGNKTIGVRQHYLKINIPETWNYYHSIGLKYDSSLGFSDTFGFRAGTSYPFIPFDLKTNRKIDLTIIPLTIMDTCFLELTSKNPINVVMDCFMKFKDIVSNFGGVLTLLWHQEYYNDYEYSFLKRSYQEILSILGQDTDAFVGSGLEIHYAWMKNHNNYNK